MARILVIDDNSQVVSMLTQLLEREGHEVASAFDGQAGIALFHMNPADLVIADIIMPKKEGVETIMEIKAEFPDAKIIAISGGGRISPDTYLNIAKRVGASRIFTKPIPEKELLAAINELLTG